MYGQNLGGRPDAPSEPIFTKFCMRVHVPAVFLSFEFQKDQLKNSWVRTRGAQLTAGYTVNTYSKPPLYYTLGAVAPLLPCLRTAAVTHSGLAALCADRQTDTRQTRLTNQPTGQPTGQQPFCQYPVSWEWGAVGVEFRPSN